MAGLSQPHCTLLLPLRSDLTNPLSFTPTGDIGGQMGLFIGASILTVLELFDYAYEVRGGSGGGACRSASPPTRPAPSQVLKHKLCRRGKCQKEAKRSSADKGVALSLDDVKRHVRERGGSLRPAPPPTPAPPAPLPTSQSPSAARDPITSRCLMRFP